MKKKPTQGGARKGAGRKPAVNPPKVHGIRCTQDGWDWLKQQAAPLSVGKWADLKAGRNNDNK